MRPSRCREDIRERYCMILGCYLVLSFFVMSSSSFAQQKTKVVDWSGLQFLLGEWSGEGGGKDPGQGTGTFSFTLDLQKTVIIRKNHSEYPASKDLPAYAHDDLMIIYQEADSLIHASYFDNERHIIHYIVKANADSAIFLSDSEASMPRFRLSYIKTKGETLKLTFDIAPSGKPEAFNRYIEASAIRKK